MKNKLSLFLICFVIFCNSSMACDICGCGIGSNYIGILPEFNQNIMGVRYQYKKLKTHIGAGGRETYLTTDETYQTAEIWGGWNIGKKWRVMAAVPVNFNSRYNQGMTSRKNGLGDISATGFYQLINARKSIGSKLLVQSMYIGAGVKLPTGQYEPSEENSIESASANIFQLGTRSVDFNTQLMYDIRLQDVGLNTTVNYKINTANCYDYQYGNKLSTNAQLYYKIKVKKDITIAPNAGLAYESAQQDMDTQYKVDVSGGHFFGGTVGMETVLKNSAIGISWQTPLQQNLAAGFVKAGHRLMAHFSYLF